MTISLWSESDKSKFPTFLEKLQNMVVHLIRTTFISQKKKLIIKIKAKLFLYVRYFGSGYPRGMSRAETTATWSEKTADTCLSVTAIR